MRRLSLFGLALLAGCSSAYVAPDQVGTVVTATPSISPAGTSPSASEVGSPTPSAGSVAAARDALSTIASAEDEYQQDNLQFARTVTALNEQGYSLDGVALDPSTKLVVSATAFCVQTAAAGVVVSFDSSRAGLQPDGTACASQDATGAAFTG